MMNSAGSRRRARRSQNARRSIAAGALVLADQQQRDQVAADHEEDLDADEPARQPVAVGVVHHHGHDGEGAHPVEAGDVTETRDRPAGAGRDRPQRVLTRDGHAAGSYETALARPRHVGAHWWGAGRLQPHDRPRP